MPERAQGGLLGFPRDKACQSSPAGFAFGHGVRRAKYENMRFFPHDEDQVTTLRNNSSTSHFVNLPLNCKRGDLLIALLSVGSGATSTVLDGFTDIIAYAAGGSSGSALVYRVCDGYEAATAALTLGASAAMTSIVNRIRGANINDVPKAVRSGNTDVNAHTHGRGQVPALWLIYLAHIITPDVGASAGYENYTTIGGNPSSSVQSVRWPYDDIRNTYGGGNMTSVSNNGRSYTVAVAPRGVPLP